MDMQVNSLRLVFSFLIIAAGLPFLSHAQVNTVDYGKNRIQYKKFDWKFYQSPNFNTYFNQGGLELAKFVAQVAEDELPSVQSAVEYSLQRSANIIVIIIMMIIKPPTLVWVLIGKTPVV